MSDFRTVLDPSRSSTRMAISDGIFTIGSCFSDAIGAHMAACKMTVAINPAGVIYNPVSIHQVLETMILNKPPAADGFTEGELVSHFDYHSSFSRASRHDVDALLRRTISSGHDALMKTDWLLITYGTAMIYTRNDNYRVVANCHKLPASRFTKSMLTPAAVEESFSALLKAARRVNPNLKVIMTISPVRHLKDTIEGNSVSKSILRVACNNITNAHQDVFYFPAFEIMMDDLRDYRFYAPDMIHPNAVATDYIFGKFGKVWFDDQLISFVDSWKSILQALQHRPFHPHSAAHREFVNATLKRLESWSHLVDVSAETSALHQQFQA